MDFLSLGEVLIDMFPAEVGRRLTEVTAFRPKPGGAPANAAVAAARLGMHRALIGKVGGGIFCPYLGEAFQKEGARGGGVRAARPAGALISFDVISRPSLWRSRSEAVERVMEVVPSVDLLKV